MHDTDMDGMNRRDFLRASGVTGASALLAGANVITFDSVAAAATREPLPLGTGILVTVTLYGGNDGLNTVIPYTDPIYAARRPGLAFSEAEVLPLADGLGLNAGMTGMKRLWDEGHLAIVRGVGYPNPNHSHFASMDIWQSASPAAPSRSGWLGRWLDTQTPNSMHALGIGNTLPPMLVGNTSAGSTLPIGGLSTPTGRLGKQLQRLAVATPSYPSLRLEAAAALADMFDNASATSRALTARVPGTTAPMTGSGLAAQLDVVAKLINAGAPTRAYSVSLSGFDTHADEKGKQTALLTELSAAIDRFQQQIDATTRRDDVTVLVYSEFGRRVPGNLSQGTDHGTSGPAFVIGNAVKGGFYGDQPGLSDLRDDDLQVTTDFRDIYATLLEGVLDTDAAAILNGWRGRLPLLTP